MMPGSRWLIALCEEFAADRTLVFSPDQQRAFIEWLQTKGAGWAHWFNGGWLIAAQQYGPSADEIARKLIEIAPNAQNFVAEIGRPIDWQAWLHTGTLPNAREWLRTQWDVRTGA